MNRSGRIIPIFLSIIGLLGCFMLWVFLPRPATPENFDPDELARLETQMWQAYYSRDYPTLTVKLWETVRTQFGGSPWDSFRIAQNAAEAARLFQPSTSREEAQAALPPLLNYYQLLQQSTGRNFDPNRAAFLELEWWQLRREHASEAQIIQVIAELYALVNNATPESMHESAYQRVQAMHYRDARRRTGLSPEEWDNLEAMLRLSYRSLKANINSN